MNLPTFLLDLRVLGCRHGRVTEPESLAPHRQHLERFQRILEKYPGKIIVTSPHRVSWSMSHIAAKVLDREYQHLIAGSTPYAWIRVPLIEEQEVSFHVIQNPGQSPFIVIGPVGPPRSILTRGVYWCECDMFDGDAQRILEELCSQLTAESEA